MAQRIPQHPGRLHAAQSLSLDHAIGLQQEAESLLEGAEYEVDSQTVLDLVRGSDCSAYGCEFIALSMKLGANLVTMDKKLLYAFPKRAMALPAAQRCAAKSRNTLLLL